MYKWSISVFVTYTEKQSRVDNIYILAAHFYPSCLSEIWVNDQAGHIQNDLAEL